MIKRNPSDILSFVRGTLKGLAYYRQNRNESIKFMAKELKLDDESLTTQMFDWHGTVLAENGRADQAWMKGAIEFTKKSLESNANISPDQVLDFSFVEKAAR